MEKWEKALLEICAHYEKSDTQIDWILVGSVASVLQGCTFIPNDIDILTKDKSGVEEFSELLKGYALSKISEYTYDDQRWLSSIEVTNFTQTFPSNFTWSKGRWFINQVEVEVVHIAESGGIADSLNGDGIWEGGQYIWNLAKYIPFHNYIIPVVPLEIQLESNLRRGRKERAENIIKTLKGGFNQHLLRSALSTTNLDVVQKQMKKQ